MDMHILLDTFKCYVPLCRHLNLLTELEPGNTKMKPRYCSMNHKIAEARGDQHSKLAVFAEASVLSN